MLSLLNELQDLPSQIADLNWLQKIEEKDYAELPLTVCPMPNRLPTLLRSWKDLCGGLSISLLLYTDFLYARPVSGLPSVLQRVPSDRESVASHVIWPDRICDRR